MKALAAFAVASALVVVAAPAPAAADATCPETLGSWELFTSGESSRDDLGTWYLGCTYEPVRGSGEFGQVSVVATWTDTGTVGHGCYDDPPEEPLPDGGVRGGLRSQTRQTDVSYQIPSQFDRQTALDLARQLVAATEPLAVPCDGSTPGPAAALKCPPTLAGLALSTDAEQLASEREADERLAAAGIGHAGCTYVGEPLPGGFVNSASLSVSWLIERTGGAQALVGIGPCGSETVSRRPDPVSVASSTKEVTSNASWSRSEPEPESFIVALTDLVGQAEPLAIACDGGDVSSGSEADGGDGGGDLAAGATTDEGGLTDDEILIAAGLIMTLLGGGSLLLKPLLSGGGPNPAKETLIAPADDDWVPIKRLDRTPAPGDLNHPMNTKPTVTHQQLVDWLHNVEAVNPGKTWQQITAKIHSTLYLGVDVHDTLPIVPIPLFAHGPVTDGYQDVALPTKQVPQWVLDPSGNRIDLGHVMAGIRSDLNRSPGRFAEMMQWANTDGGDTWQQAMEPFVATYNTVWKGHRPQLTDRAPPDQRRGNAMSLLARSYFRDPTNAEAPLSKYFEDQFWQSSP